MNRLTTLLSALLFFIMLVPAYALGACKIPQIDKYFLKPYETETIKWKIYDFNFFDDKKLGASLKFESDKTTVDFYVYDLGKSKILQEDLDKEFGNSVYDMIFSLKKIKEDEPSVSYSLPMSVSDCSTCSRFKRIFSGSEILFQQATFILLKRQKKNAVSIVSMGSDGKCFYKLRYTDFVGPVHNFEQYFEIPGYNINVQGAIVQK